MVDNPVWEICERVAEVQALLDDHVAGGKHSTADVCCPSSKLLVSTKPTNGQTSTSPQKPLLLKASKRPVLASLFLGRNQRAAHAWS